jgi:hypothetical protein
MKNKNLILLLLAGYGLYLLLRKKTPAATTIDLTSATAPATPYSSLVNPDPNAPENIKATSDGLNIQFSLNGIRKIGKVPNTI